MQLLLLLKQTAESSDRSQPLNLGDEDDLVSLGAFGEAIYGCDSKNVLIRQCAGGQLRDELIQSEPCRLGI